MILDSMTINLIRYEKIQQPETDDQQQNVQALTEESN